MGKELEELVFFLSSPQPEVRAQAVEIVLGLTGTEEGIKELSGYDVASSLVKLLPVADKDVATNAATSLVNLSQDKSVAKELVEKKLVDTAMELICGKHCPCRSLLVKLLQNLTLVDEGVSALLQEDDEKLRGLHVSRLVRLFSKSHDEGEDEFEDVGMVLVNVTRSEAGRQILLDSSKGLLKPLLRQMDSPSLIRRRGTAGTIRNCCFDAESNLASLLLLGEFLWPALLLPLAGSKAYSEEDRDKMPDELTVPLSHEREAESDAEVRTTVAEAVYLIALQDGGRRALWGVNGAKILQQGYEYEEEPSVCQAFENIGSLLVESGLGVEGDNDS